MRDSLVIFFHFKFNNNKKQKYNLCNRLKCIIAFDRKTKYVVHNNNIILTHLFFQINFIVKYKKDNLNIIKMFTIKNLPPCAMLVMVVDSYIIRHKNYIPTNYLVTFYMLKYILDIVRFQYMIFL